MKIIAALYDEASEAEQAVDSLLAEGFDSGRIELIASPATHETHAGQEASSSEHDKPNFLQRLFGIGVSHDDADIYAEGLRRGRSLLTVQCADDEINLVERTLERYNPVDIEVRGEAWRQQGWSAYDASAEPYSREQIEADRLATREAEQRIPIAEEQLRVGKQAVSEGRVRVRTYVREVPVSQDVELRSEHVTIERQPATGNTPVGADAFQDRSFEVEAFSEEAVAQKEARVVEEVVVKKDVDVHTENVSDTVKRTEVEIDDDSKRSPTGR